jgi:hypothetical protein
MINLLEEKNSRGVAGNMQSAAVTIDASICEPDTNMRSMYEASLIYHDTMANIHRATHRAYLGVSRAHLHQTY